MWTNLLDGTRLSLLVAFLSVGCGSTSSSQSTPLTDPGSDAAATSETVEVINNWSTPGQAQGFQKLIELHRSKHPGVQLINNQLDPLAWGNIPTTHLATGNPPDLFSWQADNMAAVLPYVLPLDDFLASESRASFRPNFYPELIEQVTKDNSVYALPFNVYRNNALLFNWHVFKRYNVSPPTTIAEFRSVCQNLKAAGMATPVGGFSAAMWLGNLIAAVLGPEAHCNFIKTGATNETALRQAIDLLAELFDNDLFDRGTLFYREGGGSVDAERAALMNGSVAMVITGDWLQAAVEELGWTAGVDFGMLPAPGTDGLFVFNSIVVAASNSAPHPRAALDLLDTFGSLEGHEAYFGASKGTSARKDLTLDSVDAERRHCIEDMKNARARCPAKTNWYNWEIPMVPLVDTKPVDKEALLRLVLSYP